MSWGAGVDVKGAERVRANFATGVCRIMRTPTGTGHIERCRSRHRSHDGRRLRCRHAMMLVFCAAIVSAVSSTSTNWRPDKVSAPYTVDIVVEGQAGR